MSDERRITRWSWLGRVGYREAVERMSAIRAALLAGEGAEHLLLLEHPPVYTLGRNAHAGDVVATEGWLRERGVEVVETDRGGQVTYHGPGQLVGYPVIDLAPDRRDIRRYVRDLCQSLVALLAVHGIEASRGETQPEIGVWVEGRKIASVGIHLKRWVATHGFALNVDPELAHFGGIVPCGLPGVTMTSMAREIGAAPALPELAAEYAAEFGRRFGRRMEASA